MPRTSPPRWCGRCTRPAAPPPLKSPSRCPGPVTRDNRTPVCSQERTIAVSEQPIPHHRAGGATPAASDGCSASDGGGDSGVRDGAAPTDRPPAAPPARRVRPGWLVLLAASVALGLVVGLVLVHRPGATANAGAQSAGPFAVTNADSVAADPVPVAARPVPDAPLDPTPDQVPSGALLSPSATVAIYAAPGGPPIAALPAQQMDGNHQPVGQTSV